MDKLFRMRHNDVHEELEVLQSHIILKITSGRVYDSHCCCHSFSEVRTAVNMCTALVRPVQRQRKRKFIGQVQF